MTLLDFLNIISEEKKILKDYTRLFSSGKFVESKQLIDAAYNKYPDNFGIKSMYIARLINDRDKCNLDKEYQKDDLILNYNLNNIDFNNIRKIQKEKLFNLHPKNYDTCENCNLVHFCKSNCPMRTILSNSRPNIYNCMLSKKLLPKFLERACINDNYMSIVFGNDYKKEEVCD